jgi:DNA-binding MarR family transcriptional regulator
MSDSGRPPDLAEAVAQAWEREQPGAPTSSIRIITRIWQLARLLTNERRRTLASLGIDAATLDLLSTLRRAGPPYCLSTRELTARCLVTAGAITQRVDRAQQAGLVLRLPAEPGSRAVPVELTAHGHGVIADAAGRLLTREQSLVDVLTPEQQATLAEVLAVLLERLAAGPAAGAGSPA